MSLSVTVFCGSRPGRNPAWRAAAIELGRGLAGLGIRLVYGGGRVGLMGEMADAALEAGGAVLGIIPEFLTRLEVAHAGLTELVVTDSMHSRKRLMFDSADAFVTLPGGLGTLDETVEIVTWRQLGLHDKPIFVCNVGGWADGLLAAFDSAVGDDFTSESVWDLFGIVPGVDALLARLASLSRAEPADSALM